jgi:hypothetical protein
MHKKDSYWWLDENPENIAKELCNYQSGWSKRSTNPIVEAWNRNNIAYHSAVLTPNDWQSALGFVGEVGELVKMSIPVARSLIRQIVTLVTKQRLSFTAIVDTNSKTASEDIKIINAKISDIIENQDLDKLSETVAEQACVFGSSFFYVTWRGDKGNPYAINPDKTNREGQGVLEYDGDIEVSCPTVYDISYDTRLSFKELNWINVRTIKNRWDLIDQHPDLEEKLKSAPSINSYSNVSGIQYDSVNNNDMIYVWEAYHKPTPAIKEGRFIAYTDDDTVIVDTINMYGCLPVFAVTPEVIPQTGYGYPILSNLLPCQEMFDHCASAVATNNANLAVQSVMVPRGAEINVEEIGGHNYIHYNPQNAEGGGRPEPLNLVQSSPETYKFTEFLDKHMTSISGLNSTVRGQPPAGLTSGTAIATMSANALEFLNSLQKTLDLALEKTILKSCEFIERFATTPRKIFMKTRNNKSYEIEYSGDNMKPLKGIKINRTNPLMSTLAGRAEVAEKLLSSGLIKDAQAYFSVIEGKPTSELYNIELGQEDLVESENQSLSMGGQVQALATDNHPLHIRHHAGLLNDPTVRESGQFVEAIMTHIFQHYDLARNTDPFLMAMVQTGQIPEGGLPPAQPPQGMTQQGASQITTEGQTNPQDQAIAPIAEAGMDMQREKAQPAIPTNDLLGRE